MSETLPCCDIPAAQHPYCLRCRCYHHMPVKNDPAICRSCDKAMTQRGERHCKACGAFKRITAFNTDGRYRARVCSACYNRKNYHRDVERSRAAWRGKYAALPPEEKKRRHARNLAWRKAHPMRVRAIVARVDAKRRAAGKLWQQTHPQEARARWKQWRDRRKVQIWFGGTR